MIKDKKQYSVLVIEDNPGDFTIVDDFLREQILNPFVIHAVNYKQALSILSEPDIVLDVILLDLSLPDKSGQNLVTEMLRIAPLYPVIILTGYTDIDFSIKSISLGVVDYLLKDDLNAITLYKSILYAIERTKAVAELKKSEKRASDLFNLSPQPMLVYDPQTFKFSQVNKAAIDHYGYSNEMFLTMNILDLGQKADILTSTEVFKSYKNEVNGIHKGKFIHRKNSGQLIEVELFSSPVIISGKDFRSVIVIDVTERNLYEKKIMKAIIKTQEDERYEIGGELHDNVCQLLAVSQISLGMLKGSIAPSKMPLFNQCRDHLSLVLDEIRNLSHRLAPIFFDDSNLEEAFNRLFNTFNIEKKLKIQMYFDDEINYYTINLEIQLNLFRILQEQLRNIQKYAKACLVEVDVHIYDNKLKMRISDDGVGFNVNTVKTGIGLANIKRRTELFSGKFELDSSPGNGCTISVEIPLQITQKVNNIENHTGVVDR